jgi:hypothetical protein
MILLETAYKISRSEIKRRTISVIPFSRRHGWLLVCQPADPSAADAHIRAD